MINNNLLRNLARALNQESYTIPTHFGFGDTAITPSPTDTELTGEFGDRVTSVNSRSDRTVSFLGTRATSDMDDPVNGDSIFSVALFDAGTNGDLMTALPIVATLQTSNFDIITEVQYTIRRR